MAWCTTSDSTIVWKKQYFAEPIEWEVPTKPPKETGLQYLDRNIASVIFHDPATIINWKDGTKTVVKTQNGEPFDKEKGFAMAMLKYIAMNKGNFNTVVKKWCE